jgi:hypothetical protein
VHYPASVPNEIHFWMLGQIFYDNIWHRSVSGLRETAGVHSVECNISYHAVDVCATDLSVCIPTGLAAHKNTSVRVLKFTAVADSLPTALAATAAQSFKCL